MVAPDYAADSYVPICLTVAETLYKRGSAFRLYLSTMCVSNYYDGRVDNTTLGVKRGHLTGLSE